MLAADIPVKIPTPFAAFADPSLITTIPPTTAVPGRASWFAGFVAANFQPTASGGIPPFGEDMNGVLNAISAWLKWQGAGGPVSYDATFSAEISGYPAGAALLAANGLGWWISTTDSNVTDPDTGGAGWLFVAIEQVWAGDPNTHVAGQAASATSAPSLCWDSTNSVFWVCTTSGLAAAAVWAPLSILFRVAYVSGASHPFVVADSGRVIVRSNGASAMTDTLPGLGTVANGWSVSIINEDVSANDVISVPSGRSLNGVVDGTITLGPNQNVTINADASGNFVMTAVPVPRVFSAQAVYVSTSSSLVPGVYDVDTSASSITITLEAGGILGDNYLFRDIYGTFGTNACVLARNGNTILGQAADLSLDVSWSETVITFKSGNWELV